MTDVPTDLAPHDARRRTQQRVALAAAGVLLAGCVYYQRHVRPKLDDWGATPTERNRRFPGDELAPRADDRATYAITIAAPRTDVWPWLIQMGVKRAGWYSYDLLDNGCRKSAVRPLSEFQQLNEGDVIPVDAQGRIGFPVLKVKPERCLILGAPVQTATKEPLLRPGTGPALWAFHLEGRDDDHSTRLVVRSLGSKSGSPWADTLPVPLPGVVTRLMQRKQLLGIRRRAERLYGIHRARETRTGRLDLLS